MSDYISREEAIELLHYNADETCSAVVSDFESLPAADVEPVRPMGMMRYNRIFDWQQCSVCGATINSTIYVSEDYNLDGEIHFCPRCGAKMNLEDVSGKEGKGK